MKCVTCTLQNTWGHEKQGITEKLLQSGEDEGDMLARCYPVLDSGTKEGY